MAAAGLPSRPGSPGCQGQVRQGRRDGRRDVLAALRGVRSGLGLPGQLEGPGGEESGLPRTPVQERLRPALRELPGRDEFAAPLIRLPPQELGRSGEVTRFIEDEDDVKDGLRRTLELLPPERLWILPDCGLKTRTVQESEAKLKVMVDAVRAIRREIGAD